MKHIAVQAIVLLLLVFAADLHGSAADHARQSFSYNPNARTTSVDDSTPPAPETLLYVREAIQRDLAARFAPKTVKPDVLDALDRFTFVSNLQEDSILSGLIDKINLVNNAYKDMRAGFDANFMGASFTVYARSKIIWNIGHAKTIEIKYAGEKSLSFVYSF
ncbi:MAG: hypothetical protein WC763_00520 [Candidatus Paceibacterota bacterium]|jgi:hypothetical protein